MDRFEIYTEETSDKTLYYWRLVSGRDGERLVAKGGGVGSEEAVVAQVRELRRRAGGARIDGMTAARPYPELRSGSFRVERDVVNLRVIPVVGARRHRIDRAEFGRPRVIEFGSEPEVSTEPDPPRPAEEARPSRGPRPRRRAATA
jgi:hypothetical protein